MDKLLRAGNADGDIECIHGIKALCTLVLYVAHKLIPLGMLPFTNRTFLTEVILLLQYPYILFKGKFKFNIYFRYQIHRFLLLYVQAYYTLIRF